jgi:MoaA/NifB/PqqE/SkfB family radical SAM enzyme
MIIQSKLNECIASGKISGRLWFYTNYHCNIKCRYCLTESSPTVPKRIFAQNTMVELAKEAKDMGFTGIGITGGEPFLLPKIENTISKLADILPVTILTNGTLFTSKRIESLNVFSNKDIRLQISLDSHLPHINDEMRGPDNFNKVIVAIPKLLEKGLTIRIASTVEEISELKELKSLVAKLGIPAKDHIIRNVVRRGRAETEEMGYTPPFETFPPELTLTTAGAFWSPFGPTYINGKLQTDLLICKVTQPLTKPVEQMLGLISNTPFDPAQKEGFT